MMILGIIYYLGMEPIPNNWKYKIDISEDLFKDAQIASFNAYTAISPWLYCKNILTEYISQSNKDSGNYDDVTSIRDSQMPKYLIYVSDEAGNKTIHVDYIEPLSPDANNQIDFTFTWGTSSNTNIIVKWEPQVDLYFYLIQKAIKDRIDLTMSGTSDPNDPGGDAIQNMVQMYDIGSKAKEMYDSTLTILGVPRRYSIRSRG